ncbi:TetR/AcrR family transcriptional regulator [Peribacillus psychrosaccharolyticus]|uniref:TetR/AcrR family transcriptional regulator n=1 Tax=Peribacillus psychrosaccharolyticus TaxID=1407 RepID=A0A974NKS2_PERPY|nr:TetR/AcrR family transcriptional regulator [Peribacillus psychrosaccharolyticus]MEC2054525.1 TetR/AcrR family transcriptional regulator [Peribacillus psychrosaccharolyticus]MED3744248.1 TetR/AcrR family transcriptional regulator [Peribacillus psychrosaccharolyticus]QQS99735.1 TetR/AcrR family transcriptional regulator [Peribacillus psychrosaccharolyticus]
MKKIKTETSEQSEVVELLAEKPTRTLGRKRDHTRDAKILEAAIDILADAGFDGMTMDMVAAKAKAGKATVYRRWSSKAELVQEALTWMNRSHLEMEHLPDTGTLRDDLLALLKPQSIEEGEKKLRVIMGLGSFLQQVELSEEGGIGIFDSWDTLNRELINRSVGRGDFPAHADVDLACQVIVSMAAFRGLVLHKAFDRHFYATLIDGILLPALKNPQIASNNKD